LPSRSARASAWRGPRCAHELGGLERRLETLRGPSLADLRERDLDVLRGNKAQHPLREVVKDPSALEKSLVRDGQMRMEGLPPPPGAMRMPTLAQRGERS